MDEEIKQLLLLCKRLNKFTLEEISLYSDLDEKILKKQILYILNCGYIKKNSDGYIFLSMSIENKQIKKNKQLPLMIQFHSKEIVDLIIKSFCANVDTVRTSYLTNLDDSCICYFFREFKKLIYNRQFEKLIKFHKEKPQKGKMRNYFENPAYFYIYDNQVFISEKLLLTVKNEVIFTNDEKKEFKKIHCYLKRIESHNKNEYYIHLNLAERLWRRKKDFKSLYEDLKKLIYS